MEPETNLVRVFQLMEDNAGHIVFLPECVLASFEIAPDPMALCGVREFILANVQKHDLAVIVRDLLDESRFDSARWRCVLDNQVEVLAYNTQLNLFAMRVLDQSLIKLDKNGHQFMHWWIIDAERVPKEVQRAMFAYAGVPETKAKK